MSVKRLHSVNQKAAAGHPRGGGGVRTSCTHPLDPPLPGQNELSLWSFSDQNGAETIRFEAAHTYMAYVRKYPTGY